LLAGAASPFDLEAGYCLNQLLALPLVDQVIPAEQVKPLQLLADDPARPGDLRIKAQEEVLRLTSLPVAGRPAAEYLWLRGVLAGAAGTTNAGDSDLPGQVEQYRPFLMKCFAFQDRWPETADYILQLAGNPNVPAGLRNAACSALSSWDQNVFNFQHPDARFDRMFHVYSGLLADSNPDLRIMGMAILFDRTMTIMDMQSPPEPTQHYGNLAVSALRQAIARETDTRVLRFFQSRLSMYEDRQTHPDLRRQMRELEMNHGGTNGGLHP
jgi:hypothetical protein